MSSQQQRPMNDSTLPPGKMPGARARSKVGLRKGFGLHDWVQLLRASNDLAQRKGAPLRQIGPDEIKRHSSIHDGWISLHGKVYNISPYLHYHPGGVAILKPTLGKDATALFDKYHRWVNTDGLIGPLLLGYLDLTKKSSVRDDDDDDDSDSDDDDDDESDSDDDDGNRQMFPSNIIPSKVTNSQTASSSSEFALPAPRPPKASMLPPSLLAPTSMKASTSNNGDEKY